MDKVPEKKEVKIVKLQREKSETKFEQLPKINVNMKVNEPDSPSDHSMASTSSEQKPKVEIVQKHTINKIKVQNNSAQMTALQQQIEALK